MVVKCKYEDFECPFDEVPTDPNECRACASIKSAEAQKKAMKVQEKSIELQTISSLIAAGQALPYEEKEFHNKIIKKAKGAIEDWLDE